MHGYLRGGGKAQIFAATVAIKGTAVGEPFAFGNYLFGFDSAVRENLGQLTVKVCAIRKHPVQCGGRSRDANTKV
jgi:hypothetical protein